MKCIRIDADAAQLKACRKKLEIAGDSLSQLAKVLELAGNEVRLKILYLLHLEQELCPCDLSDILDMSVPAVSQHLRKMKDGDVISTRREGQTIYYSLRKEHIGILKPFFRYIDPVQLKTSINI